MPPSLALPCPTGPATPDWLQGASSGLVVNSHALPGNVPEKLEIDVEGDVLPAQLAAEHAGKYPDNIHPVSPLQYPCAGTHHDSCPAVAEEVWSQQRSQTLVGMSQDQQTHFHVLVGAEVLLSG